MTSWTSHSSCKSTPFSAIELREGLWNSWIISEWRRIFHLYSVQPSQYAVHVLQTHWFLWNGKIKPLSPITKKKIAENMLCIRRINISGRMKDVHFGGRTWNHWTKNILLASFWVRSIFVGCKWWVNDWSPGNQQISHGKGYLPTLWMVRFSSQGLVCQCVQLWLVNQPPPTPEMKVQ